jgi:hypothetical protein
MTDRDRDNKMGQGSSGKSSSPNPQGGQSAPGGRSGEDKPRDEQGQFTEGKGGAGSRSPKGSGGGSDDTADQDEK